jgi:hypothetical protein
VSITSSLSSTIRNLSCDGACMVTGRLCYTRDSVYKPFSLCNGELPSTGIWIRLFTRLTEPSSSVVVALLNYTSASCCRICMSPGWLATLLNMTTIQIRVLTYRFLGIGSEYYESIPFVILTPFEPLFLYLRSPRTRHVGLEPRPKSKFFLS